MSGHFLREVQYGQSKPRVDVSSVENTMLKYYFMLMGFRGWRNVSVFFIDIYFFQELL